jgi:choice-of-anchor C domain-containing protein
MRFIPAVLATTAFVGLSASPAWAATELVTNGGFELDVAAAPFVANTTTLNSWTIVAGDIDHISTYWQPHSGAQSVDLYGCTSSVIRQQVSTVAGTDYVMNYWVSGNPDVQGVKSGSARVGSTAGGTDLASQSISFDTTGKSATNMGWRLDSLAFTATGATTWIEFADSSASQCFGVALDDVSVMEATEVPQFSPTATLAIGSSIGVLGLAMLGQRRKSATA